MRRYLFYPASAIFTFGIGVFVCISFVLPKINETEIKNFQPAVETLPVQIKETEPLQNFEDEKEIFQCENEAIRTVWNKLTINKDFSEDAYSIMKARQIYECEKLFQQTKTADLNNDKSDEIVVQGFYLMSCSSGGNCPTWIISKFADEYRIIFESTVGDLPEDLEFFQSRTRKFQDLKVKLPHGWAADNYAYFKFNGKKYQIVKCFEDVNSAYDYDDIRDKKLISAKLKDCL